MSEKENIKSNEIIESNKSKEFKEENINQNEKEIAEKKSTHHEHCHTSLTEEEVRNICHRLMPNYINEIKTLVYNNYKNVEETLNSLVGKDDIKEIKIATLQDDSQSLINKISKFEELKSNERKIQDQLLSIDLRVNSIQKELSSSIYKYDKIYLENLLIPGLVGDYCKFKNMKDFMEVKKINKK